MGSPLMIGCDVRNMTDVTLETLGNEDLIRINQDIECRAPYCIRQWNNPENVLSLVKPMSDGSLAIGMFNFGDVKSEMSLQFWDLGLPVSAGVGLEMYNCWTHENEGPFFERYVNVLEPTTAPCTGPSWSASDGQLQHLQAVRRAPGRGRHRHLPQAGAPGRPGVPVHRLPGGLFPMSPGGDRKAHPLVPGERPVHAVSLKGPKFCAFP